MVAIIAATSPFWHIFYEKGASDGVFGFKTMRTFLYSFGTHFILFGCSLFFFWFISKVKSDDKNLIRVGNTVAGLFCSVSLYFLLFVFLPSNSPYPKYVYQIAFIVASISASAIVCLVFNYQRVVMIRRSEHEEESKVFINSTRSFIEEISNNIA